MSLSGSYNVDPVHSSITWKVRHGGLAWFRGYFDGLEGSLDATGSAPVLQGRTKVENISVRSPDIFRGHIMGDDFFDAENFPEISFTSTKLDIADDGNVNVEGDLTLRGKTNRITGTGTFAGPVETPNGPRIAFDLETTINRHDFGVSWEAPALPSGEGRALGDEVTVGVTLQLAPAE
jgi:polyisoprenoid-binding protein YceI